MATEKYQLPSPYTYKAPPPPLEDKIYYKHLDDLRLETKDSDKVYGVATFGIGRAGTIHLSYLVSLKRVNLLYIVDDDTDKLRKIKNYYKIDTSKTKLITSKEACLVYNDPKENNFDEFIHPETNHCTYGLSSETQNCNSYSGSETGRILKMKKPEIRVDFVVIASPTYTHEQIISDALESKKAVFCEKPIAGNIENTKKLFELADKVGLPLFSAFNRRFDASYANLRSRVRAGEVGKVLTVKVCSRDSPLPTIAYLSVSGAIFHDCAVHDIDQILFNLGELPTRVSCLANANIPEIKAIDDFDTVAINMSFPSGAVAIIDLSRQCCYGYDQRVEVFGEKGMLKCENRHPVGNVELFTPHTTSKCPIDYSFPSRFGEAYRNEIDHFIDVLDGKTKLLVNSKNNLAVSKIATAVEESARTNKVITLSWTQEEMMID